MSLETLTFAKFEFHLTAQDHLSLPPYKGSTFRGAFGQTFKRIVCVSREKVCSPCLLREKCVYSYIFETPPPSDTQLMRKYPYAPHPFIILPPLDPTTYYKPGEGLEFYLTLVGRAVDLLPYFIYTFSEMGQRGIGRGKGRAKLTQVMAVWADGGKKVIYRDEDKLLTHLYEPISLSKIIEQPIKQEASSILSLNFITPTRIKYQERLILDLTFSILIRALLSRISLLAYFHCGIELKELDYKGLLEKSLGVSVAERQLRWYDWERYSQRQSNRMKLGGFLGKIRFEGPWQEFFPYIALGQWLHVGKGTGFGLGRYEVIDAYTKSMTT